MIFAVPGHIELIKKGQKSETRRNANAINRYFAGKTYSIQPKRTAKGIPEGRIKINRVWVERWDTNRPISVTHAQAEGGYTPEEYERLYEKLNPKWKVRTAFSFEYVPMEALK